MTSCQEKGPQLLEMKVLDKYPSGSALVYYKKMLYVIGDDAAWLLKLDSGFKLIDSTRLFESQGRIPKETKADIESIAIARSNKKPVLILPGSGSLDPYRNIMIVVDPATNEKKQYRLDTFYKRLRQEGLAELNIEGSASIPAFTVLASRGNKNFSRNYLVFTSPRFWEKQEIAPIKLVKVGIQADTTSFTGVSGLEYSNKTDQLLITVSTENTRNSYDDGEIGKSYLWIINDISARRRLNAINPDRVIDLEAMDSRFKGHKIESVAIISDVGKNKEIVLISDDDKGGTVLFRVKL
jgi:hypothetical protein